MKKFFILILYSCILLTLNVYSQIANEDGDIVQESKYLNLKPLPKPGLDFEQILKKNLDRDIDIYDVYAWSKVYEKQSEDSEGVIDYIENKLSYEDLNKANERYGQLILDINNNKYTHNLMFPSRLLFKNNSSEYEITPSKIIAPSYPRKAAIAKIQGYVNLMFSVYQDGSTRDIHVLNEHPKSIFTKVAIQAISQYKFNIKWKNESAKSNYKQLATQRVDFKLKGNYPFIINEKIQYLSEQFELAKKGDLKAQHNFTNGFKSLPIQFNSKIIKPVQVTGWLFDLARNGYIDSQYYLGQAINAGIGCLEEPQKGFEWVVMAAQKNYVDAQNYLYNLIQSGDIRNTSGHTAAYWLEKAAQNGSLIAKLRIAKNIATSDISKKNQLNQALTYMEDYVSSYGTLPQYYQIKALLLSKQGSKSKAKIAIKKAIKLAKVAGWDLTELEQQKTQIKKSKI